MEEERDLADEADRSMTVRFTGSAASAALYFYPSLFRTWKIQHKTGLAHFFLFHVSASAQNGKEELSHDYFKTFSLERKFDVDLSRLNQKLHSLQVQWHPDKFGAKPKEEQERAATESAAINTAYRVLKDPLRRSLYMLEIAGFPLEEGTTDVDTEFLMEIMEINERLADVTAPEKMDAIKTDNQAMLKRLRSSIASAFDAGDFREARRIAARMKYYANISAKVNQFERDRGIE